MSAGTDIKTYKQRMSQHDLEDWDAEECSPPVVLALQAEVAELRAALEAAEQNQGVKLQTFEAMTAARDHYQALYEAQPDSGRDAALHEAAKAVLRDALDRVDVHVCDARDDSIRAKGLYGPMADLYAAVAAQQSDKGSQ